MQATPFCPKKGKCPICGHLGPLDEDGLVAGAPFGPTPADLHENAKYEQRRPGGIIPGVGPVPAAGMLVGEAGGRNEFKAGRPFVGKAGHVLTTYLRAAGLARHELYITNVYPFWPGEGNPDPTPEQITAEEWRLVADIKQVKPRVIGTVGAVAARWFLGNDIELETAHGIPHFSKRAPGVVVVPCYHTAAGFYEPSKAALCQNDFLLFAYYLTHPVDAKKAPKIKIVFHRTAPTVIEDAAVDTEGLADRPWGLSWSKDGRTAHVWIYRPGKRPPKLRGRIEFHNAPHDLPILRAMGIDTRGLDVGDTIVRLFNLQLEPQALKSAAFRHLGLYMTEFDETVRPHFNKVAIRWLKRAATGEYPKPAPIPIADFQKRKDRLYSPQGPGRRMANILASYEKEPGETKIEKRWGKLGESQWLDQTKEYQAAAEAAVGSPFPDFSIFHVPHRKAVRYSGTDAAATCLLKPCLDRLVDERGLRRVYELDRRAIPFVDRMQEKGMRVDVEFLAEFREELETLRYRAMKRVQRVVGDRWFNPGSGDQVAWWLYSVKGLPVANWTDSGRGSTSDDALQMLRGYHAEDEDVAEFLTGTQDYREADKYLGTFIEPIASALVQDEVGDWRLHANFRLTRVVSGRLSSHEPNVLAMPVKTTLGRKFRLLFIARDGYVLIDCDLSQIELRTMADHSRDRRMRDAFERRDDLHALTASILFKLALAEILKESIQRYAAKTINFAVMYGISAKALLEQLYRAGIFDYDRDDCDRFIKEWFAIYEAVKRYLQGLWKRAEIDGFVRNYMGRLCYVPNIRVMDQDMREAAQRLIGNFPIQSDASDLLKRAEVRVHDYLEMTGLREYAWPLLQMHDELLLEARKDVGEEVRGMVECAMVADQRRFCVPLEAKAGVGKSWGEAKH